MGNVACCFTFLLFYSDFLRLKIVFFFNQEPHVAPELQIQTPGLG